MIRRIIAKLLLHALGGKVEFSKREYREMEEFKEVLEKRKKKGG